MTERVVCKHGNPIGVDIPPTEVFEHGGAGGDYIIQRMTLPVCGECLMEAVGLIDGEQLTQKKEG